MKGKQYAAFVEADDNTAEYTTHHSRVNQMITVMLIISAFQKRIYGNVGKNIPEWPAAYLMQAQSGIVLHRPVKKLYHAIRIGHNNTHLGCVQYRFGNDAATPGIVHFFNEVSRLKTGIADSFFPCINE